MGQSQAVADWVALVDIGSNAVRCVAARLDTRPGFEVVLRRRVQTRLGASLTDELPADAVKATLRATRRFLERVRRDHRGARVLCVATAAVRDASNRESLLTGLGELGVEEIRILSGPEEGQLGAEAALRALPLEHGVILDLGGGSLQLSPVESGVIGQSESVPLGVARLSRRFLVSDPPTPGEIEALRAEVRTRLPALLDRVASGDRTLASGGTVHALARIALVNREPGGSALPTHDCRLLHAEVSALRAQLEPMTLQARAGAPGVSPERADVIVAGAIVLEEYLARSGHGGRTACRTSVRDGVLWREAARLA